MNKMSNPQPFRISRTAKLTLATATTLLLAVVVVLLVAATPRAAQALLPGGMNLYPVVSAKTLSVGVTEGVTATNSGSFYDPADEDRGIASNSVRITASVGHVTQSGGYSNGIYKGDWNWSMSTDEWTTVGGDLNKTVTITATDSRGATSNKSFSLTVKNGPPGNDSFSSARDLATIGPSSTTISDTILATMEASEPRPSSPTKDCGITGVSNSIWFKFTYGAQGGLPPLSNPYASYNFDTQGSNFDTVLALYEGSSLGTLNQIECSNDNSLPNWNDKLSIPQRKLTLGKTYYVQLTGTGGARSGKYQLHYEPREPTVGSNTSALTASGRCSDLPEKWYLGEWKYQYGNYFGGSNSALVQSGVGFCTFSGATLPAAGEIYYAVLDITVGAPPDTLPTTTMPTSAAIHLPPGTQFATGVGNGQIECLSKDGPNYPWYNVTASPDAHCPTNPTQLPSDGAGDLWDLGARRQAPINRFQITIPLRSSNPED